MELTTDELIARKNDLLAEVDVPEGDLRCRVDNETATASERAALETLDEIKFLLGEDE